ncbi:hypothetical protein [Clostridium sp. Marseille-Q7071]
MQQKVKKILNNSELAESQKLLCVYYPKAAIKVGYSKNRASEIGC